jgi:hypothetical protein
LPLYTIWTIGTIGEKLFAVVHCGDVMIASLTLLAALVLAGSNDWPLHRAATFLRSQLRSGLPIRSTANG